MDAKSIREQRKAMATARAAGSASKVDSSTFTPAEPLDADVKTGMRPISKRAFKTGGAVSGADVVQNAGRRARKSGGPVNEKTGLANTDQKTANEDRDGKKHVGGFKDGGAPKMSGYSKASVNKEIAKDKTIGKTEGKLINALLKGRQKSDEPDAFKKGGRVAKEGGGAADSSQSAQATADDLAWRKAHPDVAEVQARETMRPKARPASLDVNPGIGSSEQDGMKKGGAVKDKKFEGSPKDVAEDKAMAKKRGMTMKEWEASAADKKHDEKGSAHDDDCKCAKCAGGRVERKRGGKVGKTNINIIIGAHSDKPGATGVSGQPVPPAPMAPPALPAMGGMPAPAHVGLPAGLGQALAGAAGAPMGGPAGGAMPQMIARKSGGRVYPIDTGAGGGQARLDKIKAYGMKMNRDLKK